MNFFWNFIHFVSQLGSGIVIWLMIGIHPEVFPFLLISYMPSVVLHELAHAVAYNLVGGKVLRIKLGKASNPTGKPRLVFRAISFKWEIYHIPLAGSVAGYMRKPTNYRLRRIFGIGAAPMINFFCFIVALFYLFSEWSVQLKTYLFWVTPISGFALANFYLFMISAIPSTWVSKNGQTVKTDGLLIIETIHMTNLQIETQLAQIPILEYEEELSVTQNLDLQQLIDRHKLKAQNLPTLRVLVGRLLETKDIRLNEYIEIFLQHPELTKSEIVTILDQILTNCFFENTISQNPRSDEHSQRLLKLSNYSVTTRGTRGSVLIDLGRIEEGKTMLAQVLAETKSEVDREFCLVFLSIAEERLGNLELADRYAAEVQALPAKTTIRNRLTKETLTRLKKV